MTRNHGMAKWPRDFVRERFVRVSTGQLADIIGIGDPWDSTFTASLSTSGNITFNLSYRLFLEHRRNSCSAPGKTCFQILVSMTSISRRVLCHSMILAVVTAFIVPLPHLSGNSLFSCYDFIEFRSSYQ